MAGAYDLVVEMGSVVLGLSILFACLKSQLFSRYLFLNIYVLVNVAFSLGCYQVRTFYGYESYQYYYFYYTGDTIQNIVGYLLIGSLFDLILRGSSLRKYVRPTLAVSFLLIVGVSARFLSSNLTRFYSEFVFEFQQNMYFVGVLLTLLLWISIGYLQAESRRFVLLVSGLGAYFAAHAVSYAVRFLFPILDPVAVKSIPLAYNVMLALWLYAFVYVPETEPVVVTAREVESRESEALASARTQ
jgi:hypothetical protein